ncbi:MAG: cytidine deaminase [Lachnospiraceae bacterium]|nr:cytidine deaminase [Lachnospiraceae bacterium]
MDNVSLVKLAIEARKNAYTPYSEYKVGAALLTKDGEVIKGCNIENASYGATNCAERTAFFKAVSEGKHDFEKIAIVGGKASETDEFSDYAYPCGICRQVMREFCSSSFEIVVAKSINDIKSFTLEEILPNGFGPENLE